MRTDSMTFEEWMVQLNAELIIRTACTWADLAGDEDPVRSAYEDGDSVEEFTTRIIRKYNLTERKNFV